MIETRRDGRRRGRGLGAASLLLGVALAALTRGPSLASGPSPQDLSRGALLERIRAATHAHPKDAAADRARWEISLHDSQTFTRRFPDDVAGAEVLLATGRAAVRLSRPDAALPALDRLLRETQDPQLRLPGLFLRGLAHAARGTEDAALADLRAVRAAEDAPRAIRDHATHLEAEVLAQAGRRDEAVALLRPLCESNPPDAELARAANADLRDLVRVGGGPPTLPDPAALSKGTLVCVLHRKSQAAALLAEARAAVEGWQAQGARVLDLTVGGFDDPVVRAFRAPTLPRVYVIGSREGRRVIVAAGVRRQAIGAAVKGTLPPARPSRLQR